MKWHFFNYKPSCKYQTNRLKQLHESYVSRIVNWILRIRIDQVDITFRSRVPNSNTNTDSSQLFYSLYFYQDSAKYLCKEKQTPCSWLRNNELFSDLQRITTQGRKASPAKTTGNGTSSRHSSTSAISKTKRVEIKALLYCASQTESGFVVSRAFSSPLKSKYTPWY